MIVSEDMVRMVRHWLSTPPNGYLGSPYGCDPKALLQQPQSSGLADEFIDKMMTDLPILKQLPRGTVNVFFQPIGKDGKRLLIQVGETMIPFEEIRAA